MAVSNFKYLIFHIMLPHSMANIHAMEGYFAEIGYKTERIQYQEVYDERRAWYTYYWEARLKYKPPETVLLDILAGKFHNLEEKILKLKETQLAS